MWYKKLERAHTSRPYIIIMSSREDEVLKRQREMANRLSQARAAAASADASKKKKMGKPPPPPPGGPKRATSSIANLGGIKSSHLSSLNPGVLYNPAASIGRGAGTTNDPIILDGDDEEKGGGMQKQKRPSLKRPPPPRANTPEMVLAQARQRASMNASNVSKEAKSTNNQQQLKRPAMRRNPSSIASTMTSSSAAKSSNTAAAKPSNNASGSLSSIILQNTDTAKYLQPNAPKLLKHYNKIEPNDYWKNIRSWDYLYELNDKMDATTSSQKKRNNDGKRKRDDGGSKEEEGTTVTTITSRNKQQHTPLPDTFTSYREYCALWSPLCLSETRAQLLSESISDIPYWRSKPEKKPIRVTIQPCKKDVNGTSENMGVQVMNTVPSSDSDTTSYKDRQFITNDIVLLVRKESDIWDATRGTLYQSSPQQKKKKESSSNNDGRVGIVGHVEYTRRSIEGLTIQVSREIWKEVGQSEMTLLKIGCNITSLREFTALCRLDSIPLLDYILGSKMSCKSKQQQQLSTTTTGNKSSGVNEYDIDIIDPSVEEKRAKKEVLSSMGGSSALGKGFAEYASHKFNLSQLGAISASAQEYGDGGFTLIKGPPGTGKVRFHFWLCFLNWQMTPCVFIIIPFLTLESLCLIDNDTLCITQCTSHSTNESILS